MGQRINTALAGLDSRIIERVTAQLAPVVAAARQVEDKVAEIRARADAATRFTPADFTLLASATVELASAERLLFLAATDFAIFTGAILARAQALLNGLATKVLDPLIQVHQTTVTQVDAALAQLDAASDVVLALTGTIRQELKTARNAVNTDLVELRHVSAHPGDAGKVLGRWGTDGSGLVKASTRLVALFDAVASGQVGAVFDLTVVRRSVEDAVRRLIPSRVSLDYEWSATLKNYASNANPVFAPRTNHEGQRVGELGKPDR